ncbi:MAG: hypothetical protein Fur0046_34080 [Cyanobacteria bacterium J069]|nr:MAG: Uma2 family endonuclease [Cyanobacteria bacterium J069]
MVSARDLDANLEPLSEPYSDEPPLESSRHLAQILLLLSCLEWWWRDRQDFFAAGNLSIYWQPEDIGKSWTERQFIGPDFFVVLDVERRSRNSWLVSQEGGRFPNIIVELLSNRTARKDRTTKKALYQDVFKTPEYFWFHPDPKKREFQGFRLEDGVYQEIAPNAEGWRWSEELGLYLGIAQDQLRYFTPEGRMIPNFEEETARQTAALAAAQERLLQERLRIEAVQQQAEAAQQQAETAQQQAEAAQQQAEAAQQQAEAERERAKRLADRLRSLGIDPDTL